MPLETMRELWDRNQRLFPDENAVYFDGEHFTYRMITSNAGRLASALVKRGVTKQDRIALMARNRAEWFTYYAACEMFGLVASTLNFRLAVPELAYICNDGEPSVVIFEDDYTHSIDQLRPLLSSSPIYVCIGNAPSWAVSWHELLAEGDPAGPEISPSPEDGVRLIYTSGSTGKPKGVIRSQAADLALARICATTSDMISGSRELIMMPMFHVGAQSMASGAHWAGGTVYLQRDFDPELILRAVQEHRINVIHLTPTILQSILDHPGINAYDVSAVSTIYYAASAMPVPLLERGIARFGDVFCNCYGSTEVGAAIILSKRFHKVRDNVRNLVRIGSLGQEHHESRACVLNDEGQMCQDGEVGEIALRSAAMMTGYWKNPAATVKAFTNGWLRTGDLGQMDSEGFVYLVDRKADMVISGGENIYSREVEEALLLHPAVSAVAVIGVPDDFWGESVMAIAVLEPGAMLTEAALIEHSGKHIARYKRPRRIIFVEALPLLPSAKVDKPTLRRTYASQKAMANGDAG